MVPDTLGHPVLIIAFVHCTMTPCIINLICCYLIMVTFCNYIESPILSTSKMLAILFLLYLRLAIKFSAHRLKTGVYACLQSVAV